MKDTLPAFGNKTNPPLRNENMVEYKMIITYFPNLFIILVILVSIAGKSSEDIVGCGGFLKSQVLIDFSKVFIKLYTKQGTLKESSDCAPTNGYYFIPIYDKGEYILKLEAPPGWFFEPEQVPLNFDGVNDPCSRATDINFIFKGFAVHGKVTSKGSEDGPENISVDLLEKQHKTLKNGAKTGYGGFFEFKPVEPGDYIIKVNDDNYKIAKDSVQIAVKNANVQIPKDSLVIAGYDVTGEVIFNGEPIKGVSFVLYGNDQKSRSVTIPDCSRSDLPQLKDKNFICHVASNELGVFKLSPVPPGNYRIRPHYFKFDVRPEEMVVEVRHNHVNLAEKFLVKGFSVGGRVMTSHGGKGIENAEVLLNGRKVTTTDKDGRYNLDSMEPGNYQLHIRSDALKYDVIDLKLSPNKPEIDTIYPSEFRVCGKVTPSFSGQDIRLVEIRRKDKWEEVEETTTDHKTGAFCLFLKPGSYVVNVKISDEEKSRGFQYIPPSQEIKVQNGPVNDVNFSQLRGRVSGRIISLTPTELNTGNEVTVSLKSQGRVIASRFLYQGQTTYEFEEIMPGQYDVEIESNQWCFKSQVYPVSVTSAQVRVPEFVQTGYKAKVFSSHETKAHMKMSQDPTAKKTEIRLAKGENIMCLPNATSYEFEPFGCHGYEKELYVHHVGKEEVLKLNAISHEVTGYITSTSPADDLYIKITQSNGQVKSIGPLKGDVAEDGRLRYRFGYKAGENQVLKFAPASENILFQPEWIEYRTRDDCDENAIRFSGEMGLIIKGTVYPPLSNVRITLKVTTRNGNETEFVQLTKGDGKYKFGPLRNNVVYQIYAEKESYVFSEPDAKGTFNAHKLAEIKVKVMDNSTKEPLQGVLLSLTGGEKYRRNSMTEADGALTFHSLSPGEYFLRPMMKEYKFEPSSQIIHIKEGVTERIELKGRRVSFSAYGTVTSLNGEAEANVLIEAVGLDACSNLQEETQSESNGQFRIRGLLPQCEYSIRLKVDAPINAHIQRINPEDVIVRTNQGDVWDINLIAFELVEHMDISVHVESTAPEHLKTLRLKLCREEAPDAPIHVVKLDSLAGGSKNWGSSATQERFLRAGLLVQLPFIHRDKTPYFIQLDSTLNKHTYTYKEPVVHFVADRTYRNFKFVFDPSPKALDSELSNSNYFLIPVLAVAALLYVYSDRAFALLQHLMGKIAQNNFNFAYQERFAYADAGISDVSIEPVAVTNRRKAKPRKT